MKIARVLVVDDCPDVIASLGSLLSMFRIAWDGASSLAEALAKLRPDGYSAVVLDLTLPDADGVQAVEALQADYPGVPVVVVTGHPDKAKDAILAGAQDVFVKPANPEALVEKIRYAIARHQVRRKYEPFNRELTEATELVREQIHAADAEGGES